jgi:hypothetical protein
MTEYKNWRELIDMREVVVVIFGVLAVTAITMFFATSCVERHAKKCEAKGGVYHWNRDGSLCLKKDVVL